MMSHGEFDIVDVELDIRFEALDVFDIHAEVVDVAVILIDNIGPPGPKGDKGDKGDVGPMDPGLSEHIMSELPHPIYDDGASFTLLYENAKV